MTILLVGGGTGGHITPLLAVAHELKRLDPEVKIVYVGDRGGKFSSLTDENKVLDEVHYIFSGKFRRYHGRSWLERLVDVKTLVWNLRDGLYICLGLVQSWFLLKKVKPDVVFLKGSKVSVPVGVAAGKQKLKIVTHDSDASPGLANRIVSKWATMHATGMPAGFYNYPKDKIKYVGVIVGHEFSAVDHKQQLTYKRQLDLPEAAQLLFITGGSLGAKNLNDVMVQVVPDLLKQLPNLYIIHQVGKGSQALYDGAETSQRLAVREFIDEMYRYYGAADVVITRAGATNLAELGVQGKATIVVPNPILTGGHQLQNAKILDQNKAAVVLQERAVLKDPNIMKRQVQKLLSDTVARRELGQNFKTMTMTGAATKIAKILLEIGSTPLK